jgi:hypothetical protein
MVHTATSSREELTRELDTYMRDLAAVTCERDASRAAVRQSELETTRWREKTVVLEAAAASREQELGTLRAQASELLTATSRGDSAERDREVLTRCAHAEGNLCCGLSKF